VGLDERYGAKFMNDYRYISDFSVDTSTALFHTNHDFLKTSLRVVEEEKAGNADVRCIVVTHHLPSHAVVHDKYKDMTHLTPFFAAHCDDLLHKPVDYWVYGHTHVANSHEINGVHVLCNPFGYPSETSYVDMQKTIVV
jgi:predicted phosphodiesterase